jgi:hypothetical protein
MNLNRFNTIQSTWIKGETNKPNTYNIHGYCSVVRGENGRKRSINTKIIFVFIFFLGNEIKNGNSRNENVIGNSETSETKVRYEN